MKYSKMALFTDIHLGRHNNSELHNQDCIRYIKWFTENVVKHGADSIAFLGDWHEHRSSISGMTLHYSKMAAEMLNSLDIPIYWCTGNHDLYYRNTRDIFTTVIFENMKNIIIVNEPLELPKNKTVITPFLFDHEYDQFFKDYSHCDVVMGHFEFKGFVLTGETFKSEHGPDPSNYSTPTKIYSGHFHKRQSSKNVHYIGNTFPMDFGDANDFDRGMALHDFNTGEVEYINWKECPKYIKISLSEVIKSPKTILKSDARVKVIVDEDISLSETNQLRETLSEEYGLREILLEESYDTTVEMTDIEKEIEDLKLEGVNQIVPELLKRIKNEKIDNDKLVEIYRSL